MKRIFKGRLCTYNRIKITMPRSYKAAHADSIKYASTINFETTQLK